MAQAKFGCPWALVICDAAKLCALLQLGLAHKWYPRWHLSPGWASLHPCSRLYAQHNRSPLWVCRLFPIKPLGMLGPRPRLPFLPLLLPLLLEGLRRSGSAFLDDLGLAEAFRPLWQRPSRELCQPFVVSCSSLYPLSWYSCLVVAHVWSSLGSRRTIVTNVTLW